MNKNIILFDLDGTVIDSKEGIFNAIDYTFHKLNMPIPPNSVKQLFIGPSIGASLKSLFGFSQSQAESAVAIYREFYSTIGVFQFELYDGIAELVTELKSLGNKVAIATKKPEIFAKVIIESTCLPFDIVFGSQLDDHNEGKAHIIKRAANVFCTDCNYSTAVMIGDSKYDIIGAAEANVDSIAVQYGYGSNQELIEHNPTWICSSVDDLRDLLLK